MRRVRGNDMSKVSSLLASVLLTALLPAWSQTVPGSMDVHWNAGTSDCATSSKPLLQVHRYEAQTFILRQNLCANFEGNFLYLLIGSERALLIDSGAVADAARMPLPTTVQELLPE